MRPPLSVNSSVTAVWQDLNPYLADPLMIIMRSVARYLGISLLVLAMCIPFVAAAPESLVGKNAPPFSLKNVMTGETVSLEVLGGKVLLLDFWATWCGPCKEALPHIAEISRTYKDQNVLAISIDLKEDEETVRKFAKNNQMDWIVIIDRDGSVAKKYEVTAIPTLFLVDQNGVVRYAHVGFFKELKDELSRRISELLKEKPDVITCNVSSASITMEDSILVSGTVTPGRSAPVIVKVTRPDGSSYTVNLVSGADGSYSYRFTPDRIGSWSASASIGKVVSSVVKFQVKEKPMLQNPTLVAMIAVIVIAIAGTVAIILVRRSRKPRTSSPTASAPSSFCISCGSAIPADAQFCPKCGTKKLST